MIYFCYENNLIFPLKKVALLSDYGSSSFELIHLKSSILSADLDVDLIDLTHEVRPFDIMEAYFFINMLWTTYGSGTCFALLVGTSISRNKGYIMAQCNDRFFIAPDNGLLPMFLPYEKTDYRVVDESIGFKELLENHTTNESWFNTLNKPLEMVQRIAESPQYDDRLIKGAIIHVDRFGNLYTNISEHLFKDQIQNESYTIRIKRDEQIHQISQRISDVQDGDTLAYFDSTKSHLVIGVNKGNASRLLGLGKGKYIFIEKNNDSKTS